MPTPREVIDPPLPQQQQQQFGRERAEPAPIKQRRSSSISNADIPPTSLGSLTVDFVQVRRLKEEIMTVGKV